MTVVTACSRRLPDVVRQLAIIESLKMDEPPGKDTWPGEGGLLPQRAGTMMSD